MMKAAKESGISEESKNEIENVLQEDQPVRDQLIIDHDKFDADDIAFVMDTVSEAIELIAHYNSYFTREIDRDYVSSLCRIISEYLRFHAGLLNGDIRAI